MNWNDLAKRIKQIPTAERETDAQVNLSKEPDRLTDVGPIGDIRQVRGEWVIELEDDSE